MAEQLTGVLREVVALQTGRPRPALSTLFGTELRVTDTELFAERPATRSPARAGRTGGAGERACAAADGGAGLRRSRTGDAPAAARAVAGGRPSGPALRGRRRGRRSLHAAGDTAGARAAAARRRPRRRPPAPARAGHGPRDSRPTGAGPRLAPFDARATSLALPVPGSTRATPTRVSSPG